MPTSPTQPYPTTNAGTGANTPAGIPTYTPYVPAGVPSIYSSSTTPPPQEEPSPIVHTRPTILIKTPEELIVLTIDFPEGGTITGYNLTTLKELTPAELLHYVDYDVVSEARKCSELTHDEGGVIFRVFFNRELVDDDLGGMISDSDTINSYSLALMAFAFDQRDRNTFGMPTTDVAGRLMATLDLRTFINLYRYLFYRLQIPRFTYQPPGSFQGDKARLFVPLFQEGLISMWCYQQDTQFHLAAVSVAALKRKLSEYTTGDMVSRTSLKYYNAVLSTLSNDPTFVDNGEWKLIRIDAADNSTFEVSYSIISTATEFMKWATDVIAASTSRPVNGPLHHQFTRTHMSVMSYSDPQIRNDHETECVDFGYNMHGKFTLASTFAVLHLLTGEL